MSDARIRDILEKFHTVAVVGLSPDPSRPSHRVAAYLKEAGYRVVPVRPGGGEILGEKVYERLADIPFPVQIVDVFRRAEAVPDIAEEAVKIGAGVLWLQEGITHPEAERMCSEAGMEVVADRCMLKEHRRLVA